MKKPRSIRPARSRVASLSPDDQARLEMLRLGGASLEAVAAKFGLSRWAVMRWMKKVSPQRANELMAGHVRINELANKAAEEGDSIRDKTKIVVSILFGRLLSCAEAGDNPGVAALADKLLNALRQYGQLTGELRALGALVNVTNNTVNIIASPTFIALSEGLLEIARSHPEARGAIVGLLERVSETETPLANGSRFSAEPALIEADLADVE
jgi:hypothetical protein